MEQWIIYALLSAAAAAGVAIFGKLGVSQLDPTLATTVRAVIMAIFLIGVSLALGKAKLLHTINSRALVFIILAGISGAISWLFYFVALPLGPTAGVAALDRLSVVFVLIFAALFLGENITWLSALGIVNVTIGAILISLK